MAFWWCSVGLFGGGLSVGQVVAGRSHVAPRAIVCTSWRVARPKGATRARHSRKGPQSNFQGACHFHVNVWGGEVSNGHFRDCHETLVTRAFVRLFVFDFGPGVRETRSPVACRGARNRCPYSKPRDNKQFGQDAPEDSSGHAKPLVPREFVFVLWPRYPTAQNEYMQENSWGIYFVRTCGACIRTRASTGKCF